MFKNKRFFVYLTILTLFALTLRPMLPNVQAVDNSVTKSEEGLSGTIATASYEEWNSSKIYLNGDMVTYNGANYMARWWTQGETPGIAEVWKLVTDPSTGEYPQWNSSAVYVGGDIVTYQGNNYRAQWWTQGETPGVADVWQLIGGTVPTPTPVPSGTPTVTPVPTITPTPPVTPVPTTPPDPDKFKVVGYYPSWEPGKVDTIQYNNLTHINYAFAIPTSDGALLPLENAQTAQYIIQQAHARGVKVLLAVGGWSYNGTPLESTFMAATSTPAKIVQFGNNIIAMAKQYGFDGVDMDWEHPRTDGTSKQQYEDLMVYLSTQLKKDNLLLTAAVLSGVTPDGVIYWDSAAHTDTVINSVDWFNVMAYDGGDGNRHSTYEFAVMCAKYWRDTRHMPANKVVLGVPFYGRPSWASYAAILQANPNAYNTDVSMINGMEAHYNGIPTIQAKTQWACDNIGGIMIWELSQDTTDLNKSLLNAIGNKVRSNNKW